MKIIFLDIDGVVKVDGAYSQEILKRLVNLCNDTGAKIVLSSDLRSPKNSDHWKMRAALWPWLVELLHDDWMTPIIHQDRRAEEIAAWLDRNDETTSFVILDDSQRIFSGAAKSITDHIIWCNNRFGFVESLVEKAVEILNRQQQ